MMLNQLILARGYVLAPMLPTTEPKHHGADQRNRRPGMTILQMLRRYFAKDIG
jgi:hypothetical protein